MSPREKVRITKEQGENGKWYWWIRNDRSGRLVIRMGFADKRKAMAAADEYGEVVNRN